MRRYLLIALLILGCRASRERAITVPTTQPNEPIGVTVTKGDFIVVGKQENGIAVYLTIDRRERTCLVEAQNATDKPIAIFDTFTDSSIYRGYGFASTLNPTTQPFAAFRAPMIQVYPSQVLSGSLSFPDGEAGNMIRLRLYHDDPSLTRWIDIESPEFTIAR